MHVTYDLTAFRNRLTVENNVILKRIFSTCLCLYYEMDKEVSTASQYHYGRIMTFSLRMKNEIFTLED